MIRDAKHWLWTPVLHRYVMWKLRRAFRGLWVRGEVTPGDEPIIAYANHTNFWDGFIAYALLQRAGRDVYAVMEEQNLARFRFLARLGAVSIRRGDPKSSLETLRHCKRLLARPKAALVIFPQGKIEPPNAPLRFERGLELVARMSRARCVPIAIRYTFFEHEYPDVLLQVGAAHAAEAPELSEAKVQAQLAELDRTQAPHALTQLLHGRRSVAERQEPLSLGNPT